MNRTSSQPRRSATKAALGAVSLLALMALLTGCLSADQQSDIDMVNAARKSNRLAALSVDSYAATKAQGWSQHMARTGVLEHSGGGTKVDFSGYTHWCSMGENVGMGPSVSAIHDAFMASPAHKEHILGKYDRVGTGVYQSGRIYWVTEVFLRTC